MKRHSITVASSREVLGADVAFSRPLVVTFPTSASFQADFVAQCPSLAEHGPLRPRQHSAWSGQLLPMVSMVFEMCGSMDWKERQKDVTNQSGS